MGGIRFPAGGASTGQAPRTVWFGSIVDRLNLLFPGDATTGIPVLTSSTPANYGNQWVLTRASLGAFTTAPDGTTNTMQLIKEDSSTNTHFANTCVSNTGIGFYPAAMRLAAFMSNGGRRAHLAVYESNYSGGVRAIFDLAGGQIGVAAATFGSTNNGNVYTPIDTQMIPVGGGVYLCWMDYTFYNPDGGPQPQNYVIQLDNGTGTSAASTSYSGNGTSGVNVWKTNFMPVGAYCINNVTRFDDFNNTSTIDMGNTLAPGFNWYRQCTFEGLFTPSSGNTNNPTPTSAFSVAGSVLTLNSTNSWNSGNDNQVMLTSAAQLDYTQGTYVGTGFNTPALFEINSKWNFGTSSGYHVSMWGGGLEWVMRNLATTNPIVTSFERDMSPDIESGNLYPQAGGNFWPHSGVVGGGLSGIVQAQGGGGLGSLGPGLYSANIDYSSLPHLTAELGGQQYVSDGTAFPGSPPNAHWTAVNYPASFSYPQLVTDYTAFHTYSNLIIPVVYPGWAGPNAAQACAIGFTFFDGGGCGSASNRGGAYGWRPKGAPINPATAWASPDYISSVEWQKQILWINTGINTHSIDWIRVSQ